MYIAIFILIAWSIASIFIIWNLLKKYERIEDYTEALENWVNDLNLNLNKIYGQIKAIDEKGSFQSDDEVGSTFDQIRDTINLIDKYILKEEGNNPDDSQKEK